MKVKYTGERISVGEAAKMLSMNEQKVKVLMQRGKLPIGIADKSEKGNTYTYYIYKGRVMAFMKGFDLISCEKCFIGRGTGK